MGARAAISPTPDARPESPTQARGAAAGLDLVDSYADRALSLPAPHGPTTCGCLVCADARVRIGMAPAEPDYAELFGARWTP
jgi:hypothetical protein